MPIVTMIQDRRFLIVAFSWVWMKLQTYLGSTEWSWNQIDNSVINISHGELNSTTLNNCYQRQIVHNKVNIEWDLCFVDIAPALNTIEHCDGIYWVIFHLKHFRHDKDTTRRLKVLLNFSNITKCSTDDSWQYFQPVSSTWFYWCIYCS